MSMKDIIKNRVYEGFANNGISIWTVFLILAISCIIGFYIFLVYKYASKSAFYSKDLNITLAGITIIVAAIMIAMQSSLIVSLGMIGALSIVRFRTAIKNPMDLLYLFWAISAGIICGVQLYLLSALLCVMMTISLYVLEKMPNSKAPALLVIRTSLGIDIDYFMTIIKKQSKYMREKSTIIKNNECEMIIEIRTNQKNELMSVLQKEKGIISVSYLEHNGELRV